MYNEFKDIFNYLVSIRKLKTYLSIDIEFPITWKIPKRFVDEDKIMENQKVNEDKRFFSFVSEFNQNNLDKTVQNIKNIISYNKEIEMKERLLKQKIDELKKIFESKNLENLQTLKFELLEQQLDDGEEDFNEGGTSANLAEE
jgi:restriction endonuclease Mrr